MKHTAELTSPGRLHWLSHEEQARAFERAFQDQTTESILREIAGRDERDEELDENDAAFMLSLSPSGGKRSCGTCVECCVSPAILPHALREHEQEFAKPACEACPALREGGAGGCSIYSKRPEVCKTFECAWRMGLTDCHPQETGVVFVPEATQLEDGTSLPFLVGYCRSVADARMNQDVMDAAFTALQIGGVHGVTLRDDKEIYTLVPGEAVGMVDLYISRVDPTDPLRHRILEPSN